MQPRKAIGNLTSHPHQIREHKALQDAARVGSISSW
jgi:hypothetical protein